MCSSLTRTRTHAFTCRPDHCVQSKWRTCLRNRSHAAFSIRRRTAVIVVVRCKNYCFSFRAPCWCIMFLCYYIASRYNSWNSRKPCNGCFTSHRGATTVYCARTVAAARVVSISLFRKTHGAAKGTVFFTRRSRSEPDFGCTTRTMSFSSGRITVHRTDCHSSFERGKPFIYSSLCVYLKYKNVHQLPSSLFLCLVREVFKWYFHSQSRQWTDWRIVVRIRKKKINK